MILMKKNLFHLLDIKFNIKTFQKKFRLSSVLVFILFVLPLLSSCGTAFVASKQDDILTQIDVWSAENEYGKAFATLDYVKTSHPQYAELQIRKKTLLTQATEYELRIDKQIKQFIATNQWSQALDLIDQAKEKYPLPKAENNHRILAQTEKYLLAQQQKALSSIDQDIMLERSQWMIKTWPIYQEKLNTDPRNEVLKKQLDDLNEEAKSLSQKLALLSQQAINKKHYKTAKIRINQAIALDPTQKHQAILTQLKNMSVKSYKKKKKSQNITRKIQQNTLLQDIEKSYYAGDLLKTRQLISELDEDEQNDSQIIQLKQELERSINYTTQRLAAKANTEYTNGQFHQAIKLWEQVLIYDPENVMAKKNIIRAEKVIEKLSSIREKQQN